MFTMNSFKSPMVAALLAALMAGQAACTAPTGTNGGSANGTTSAARATYTGEQLFRGIYFGEGEVGTKLPEMWGTAAIKSAKEIAGAGTGEELSARLSQTADRIAAEDPSSAAVSLLRERAEAAKKLSPADVAATVKASQEAQVAVRAALVDYINTTAPTYFNDLKAAVESGDPVAITRLTEQGRKLLGDGASAVRAPNPDSLWVEIETAIYAVVAVAVFIAAVAALGVKNQEGLTPKHVALIADRFAAN
jgi:hypothetical protein